MVKVNIAHDTTHKGSKKINSHREKNIKIPNLYYIAEQKRFI